MVREGSVLQRDTTVPTGIKQGSVHSLTSNPQCLHFLCPCGETEMELLEEEAEINQAAGDSGKIGGLRRRRRTFSRTLSEHMKPNKQYGQETEPHRDGNIGKLVILISEKR